MKFINLPGIFVLLFMIDPVQVFAELPNVYRGRHIPKQMLMVQPIRGLYSQGLDLEYFGFKDAPGHFHQPAFFQLSFLQVKKSSGGSWNQMVSGTVGGGILRRFARTNLLPVFEAGLVFGNKNRGGSGESSGFFFGLKTMQKIMYVPTNQYNVNASMGLFQTALINNDIYPWDVGLLAGIGFQF